MRTDDLNEGFILHQLHQGIWMEELLSQYFAFIVDKILSKKQRQILELKVEGYSDKEVGNLLGIKTQTLDRQIKSIKLKLRNRMELRVDNLKPDWMRRYGKHTKKKKKTQNK